MHCRLIAGWLRGKWAGEYQIEERTLFAETAAIVSISTSQGRRRKWWTQSQGVQRVTGRRKPAAEKQVVTNVNKPSSNRNAQAHREFERKFFFKIRWFEICESRKFRVKQNSHYENCGIHLPKSLVFQRRIIELNRNQDWTNKRLRNGIEMKIKLEFNPKLKDRTLKFKLSNRKFLC